jgi:hypothetical protein
VREQESEGKEIRDHLRERAAQQARERKALAGVLCADADDVAYVTIPKCEGVKRRELRHSVPLGHHSVGIGH